jgi:hypothetical protein
LPGCEAYNPSLPWISKVRSEDEKNAAYLFAFMDDFRSVEPSKKEAWLAGRQAASILTHLGIQDAPYKRRDMYMDPGAWAGAVVRTDGAGVHVLVSQERWDRATAKLVEVRKVLETNPNKMCRKRHEEIRGFLVYVTRTHIRLAPYLKGIHMTINGWRAGRDSEAWRLEKVMVKSGEEDGCDGQTWVGNQCSLP